MGAAWRSCPVRCRLRWSRRKPRSSWPQGVSMALHGDQPTRVAALGQLLIHDLASLLFGAWCHRVLEIKDQAVGMHHSAFRYRSPPGAGDEEGGPHKQMLCCSNAFAAAA